MDTEDGRGFDEEVRDLLEEMYQDALRAVDDYTTDQIMLLIVARNLQSMANTFLMADSAPDIKLDLKQVALGLLGTKDWITETLEFPEQVTRWDGV